MDRLPEELLVTVFKIHVWCNSNSPQRLLRVCRRWYSIANNTGSLWGDIILRDEETYKRILHTDRSLDHKTHCDSIKSLASAIERTKASKFELTLDFLVPDPSLPRNFELLNPSWFSDRCRALTINKFHLVLNLPEALLSNLGALERLDIHLGYTTMPPAALLEVVQRTSPLLWHLRWRGSTWNGFSKYPKLAARLTLLGLTENHMNSGFTLDLAPFSSLETLIWKSVYIGSDSQITGPFPPKLHTLSTTTALLVLIPPELYSGLRTLSYSSRPFEGTFHGLGRDYEFPVLQHLEINGSWGSLADIRAPSLQSLVLLDRINSRDILKQYDNIGRLKKTPIRPKKLDIDVRLSEPDLRSLLNAIGEDLEDLHIIYVEPGLTLRKSLIQGFLGIKTCPPVCTMLRRLTVISTIKKNSKRIRVTRLRAEERLKKIAEERLKKIADARMGDGVLERVRYGWCQYGGNREHPIRDETMEWSQISVR